MEQEKMLLNLLSHDDHHLNCQCSFSSTSKPLRVKKYETHGWLGRTKTGRDAKFIIINSIC